MNFVLKEFCKECIPQKSRNRIWIFIWYCRSKKEQLKACGYRCLFLFHQPLSPKEVAMKDWAFGRKLNHYPYPWIDQYDKTYQAGCDENGMGYVLHNGKRLYIKRSEKENIQQIYKNLLIEQDLRSAHRYVKEISELRGKTLLDIGCAEALFALDVIEEVEHAYLFECDEEWIEALEKTFEPWGKKVTIVRKYISDETNENCLCLDDFFKDKSTDNLFIKMDIEGYERRALMGGIRLLTHSNVQGSICVYHRPDDPKVISEILKNCGYDSSIEEKYIYFGGEFRLCMLKMVKHTPA